MSNTKVLEDITEVVFDGGDERTFINPETKLNKYHLHPLQFEGLLNRGSCTCNILTPDGAETLKKFESKLENQDLLEIRKDQIRRMKDLFIPEDRDKFEIFFGPSGSDLVYLPLMFAQLLNPNKKILNIMTATEELGSGSAIAAAGNYFMAKNQFGDHLEVESPVSKDLKVDLLKLSARSEDGKIIDNSQEVLDQLEKYTDHQKIGNLVISSKSGIKDNDDIIEKFQDREIQWIVDLCQFRTDREILNTMADRGVMTMITGSKFYQAPPFCGALMVPKTIIDKLKAADTKVDPGFKKIFSACDIPECLPNIREQFEMCNNPGVIGRWEIAVDEIEKYYALEWQKCDDVIAEWSAMVKDFINESKFFQLMPDNTRTTRSIVSFRVKKDGEYLDYDQLRDLHKHLLYQRFDGNEKYDRISIGQPVKFGNRAFIRLALGAQNIREIIANNNDFSDDQWILNLLEKEIENYVA